MALSAQNISKEYKGKVVLNKVSIGINDKDRIALVGANGVGKSTLIRILAGVEGPDEGFVTQPRFQEVGYLAQQVDLEEGMSVSDFIANRVAGLRHLEDQMRGLEEAMANVSSDSNQLERVLEEYGIVSSRFEVRGGYDIESRTREVFHGLGIGGIENERLLQSLSGGEKARVALAALLLASPDVLLLDEPTNHLDDTSITWLGAFLAGYRGGVCFVSHDRSFINAVCTAIQELDETTHYLQRYDGNYDRFLEAKAGARERAQAAYDEQTEEIKSLKEQAATTARSVGHNRAATDNDKRSFNNRGAGAERAISRNVRNAQMRLDRLLEERVKPPPEPLRFTGQFIEGRLRAGTVALTFQDLSVGIAGRIFASHINAAVSGRERIAIVGPNGAGKSTLLRTLVGELPPIGGQVVWSRGLRLGYLRQDPDLPDELTAREAMAAAFAEAALTDIPIDEQTGFLVRLGLLDRESISKPISELSVGQQRKLELGILVALRPDVLLLDEPTNHLALELLEQFEQAVFDFSGPVFVVTHDKRLLFRAFSEEWVMTGESLEMRIRNEDRDLITS